MTSIKVKKQAKVKKIDHSKLVMPKKLSKLGEFMLYGEKPLIIVDKKAVLK